MNGAEVFTVAVVLLWAVTKIWEFLDKPKIGVTYYRDSNGPFDDSELAIPLELKGEWVKFQIIDSEGKRIESIQHEVFSIRYTEKKS